jgi:hypothetical protein
MRFAKLAFALLGLTATLFAEDSFVGHWKLNLAKSKYVQGNPPREQLVTMKEVNGNLSVRVDAITADGSKTVVFYEVPLEGGKGKMFETSPAYDGISGKHLGPNEREIIRWKDGKEVFNARSTVAPDGKSMVGFTKGVSPLGKPVEATLFYEKLKD